MEATVTGSEAHLPARAHHLTDNLVRSIWVVILLTLQVQLYILLEVRYLKGGTTM